MTGPAVAAERPTDGRREFEADVAKSVRDGAQLGLSLLATWAVALVVRVMIPRHLGPAAFGTFDFADAFTTTVFVIGSLGLETYIRKEMPTRASLASSFFAGTIALRTIVGLLVMGGAIAALRAAGQPVEVLRLVAILGVVQILSQINGSYGALLQSVGAVGGQSVANVAAKIVWAAGIIIGFALGGGVRSVALVMLLAEVVRFVWLAVLARTRAGLRYRLDVAATVGVLFASFPYYLTHLAQNVYTRIDVSIMAFLTTKVEVGWYGAAQNIAGMSLLLSPVIGWVLLPLSSRVGERSREEMLRVFRRAMDAVLAIAVPIALTLGVGASLIIR
ncbi:MAG: oligosaccharide flippase family protein, partial [Gemmatimonadaceae bacterium]|nr:oligosaccharide flippase family protein [Gemmatimonadaceae bacterium]